MIRIAMRNGDILNLLVRCALFEKKLNSHNIANYILEPIEIRVALDMCFCCAVICIRTSTNKNTLSEMKRQYPQLEKTPPRGMLTFLEY